MNRFRIGFFKKFFLLLLLAGPVLGQAGAPAGQQVVVVDFDEVLFHFDYNLICILLHIY